MKKLILLSVIVLVGAAVSTQGKVAEVKSILSEDAGGRRIIASRSEGRGLTMKSPSASYKPGELLVRFARKADGRQRTKAERTAVLASIDGGNIKRSYHLVPGLTVVKLPEGLTVENAMKRFKNKGEILYAERNYEVYALATPNDTYFDELWGMHNTGQTGGTTDADIDAPEAWDIENDANEIVVAVIDSGVDYTHPDLAANMWTDANGSYGYDFVNDDNDPMDDFFHGTHCAGIIGAVGNNNTGIVGVCWDVQIMALKFLSSSGSGYTDDAIEAIEYAVDNGADVLSNSWGGGASNQALKDAIEAAGANGVIFVAAAGNDGFNNDTWPHYPSSYDCNNIIAVLSTNHYDEMSWFSNWGANSVDLGAPGTGILSTFPTTETGAMQSRGFSTYYETISGTSMATPHVAGACALVWSEHLTLSNLEVKATLLETVDPTMPGICVSGGRLNLYWAVLDKQVMNTTQMKGYDTIQGAIDEANDLDIIRVRPGTYYENVDFNGVCCTLTSNNPEDPCVVAATIIDGNESGRVVTFDSSEDANAVLTGFTITDGNVVVGSGGGIYCNNTSPTISKCVITSNYAGRDGGGMYNYQASPTVTDCSFIDNTIGSYLGGGMCNYSSSAPTITNCLFSGNTAKDGGGMANNHSSPTLTDCVFYDNTATIMGGAMFNIETCSATITNCVFSGNSSSSQGGGVWNTSHTIGDCVPTMTNCIFSSNTASNWGGGVGNRRGSPTLINCTIAGNQAGYGGGIGSQDNSSVTVTNCILWGDSAVTDGNEIHVDGTSSTTVTYSDVQGGYAGTGNINSDPNFVDPNDPNGPDDVWCTSDDGLALDSAAGSPCIDAGDNDVVSLAGDIAGNLRRRDDPCTSDSGNGTAPIVDMGAYEYVGDSLTLYVDVSVSGSTHDGLSWSTAFDNIQEALDYSIDDDEIRVAEGTYVLDVTIGVNTAVDIYGGYDGSTGLRDWQSNTTTIDGANTTRCLYVDANATIDGFTVANGYTSTRLPDKGHVRLRFDGGGMYAMYNAEPKVANCTFSDCKSPENLCWGGGLCANVDAIDVSNCTFSGNSACLGGGLFSFYCDVNAADCNFTGNSAYDGGGAYAAASSPVFERCTFSQNSADMTGGGLRLVSGTAPKVKYCDFGYNTAKHGGGMFCSSSAYEVNCCNFRHNSASEYGGGLGENGGYGYPPASTIIDCNFYDNSASISGGAAILEMVRTKIEDCNFTENSATTWGGAIFTRYHDSGWIKYSNFTDNEATSWGGAICNEDSDVSIGYCTFTSNTAHSAGGAIRNFEGSSPLISGCTFSQNSATSGNGGAIYNDRFTDPSIRDNCVFIRNSATSEGGAIYNGHDSYPLITGAEFKLNTAGTDGGAMYFEPESYPTVDDCWFEKNAADDDAGAIYFDRDCTALITSCVFWDNNSVDDGGAIYHEDCQPESYAPDITNCTFFENEAGDDGGAIYNDDSDPDITNCILWEDTAGGSGDEIYDAGTSNPDVYKCLEDEDPDFEDESDPDGPDDEWGTSDDGLRPEPDSDAIDEGSNSAAEDDHNEEDIAGKDRIIDGDEDGDDDVDIGAYEYDP